MKVTKGASVSKSAPSDKRKWGVWPKDEKTFKAMGRLFCAKGRTGPMQIIYFRHSVTNNTLQPRYVVPKSVVDKLSDDRVKHGYDFYAFSKLPKEPVALYQEGKRLHLRIVQKIFDGSAIFGNKRIQSGKLTESRR